MATDQVVKVIASGWEVSCIDEAIKEEYAKASNFLSKICLLRLFQRYKALIFELKKAIAKKKTLM